MDTKKYEALVTAIHAGSFTKAANELGYTQSGMTHMMSKLEAEIGFSLFKRGHYGVALTKEGQEILPDILGLLEAKQKLQSHINQVKNYSEKSLSIGCYPSISMQWLPLIMQQYKAEFPDVDVKINLDGVEGNFRALEEEKVDLIFASYEFAEQIDWIDLRKDPLLAILPLNDTTAAMDRFPIEQFNGADFLMPYLGFDKDINRVFQLKNAQPNIRPIRLDDPAIIAMVEHGWGISILSELIMKDRTNKVRALPLEPFCSRRLGIALKKNIEHSELVRRFIDCSKKTVAWFYAQP